MAQPSRTEQGTAAGRGAGGSDTHDADTDGPGTRASRRQEIVKADPYYPHTGWRAVWIGLTYFLMMVGLASLIMLLTPGRVLEWDDLLVPAAVVTSSVGFQFLFRRARVQVLENMGQIAPCRASRGSDTTGGPGRM